MSKGDAKFVVAEGRTPEARQIVSRQSELIAKLKASGQPSLDAERALLTYMSALKHLEAHEAVVRADVNARKHEPKKFARGQPEYRSVFESVRPYSSPTISRARLSRGIHPHRRC
jgi:hypothetical protein